MDKLHYEEMVLSLDKLIQEGIIQGKDILLFGHCNATEELVDLLLSKGFSVKAILDNNQAKIGGKYKGIEVKSPDYVMEGSQNNTLVCIVARAYDAMAYQLRKIGYKGSIQKLVDYNSYADYSLAEDTMARMYERAKRGEKRFRHLRDKYPEHFFLFCPFAALGDIYYMMSYLPYYLQKRQIDKYVICVIGNAGGQVVSLFGEQNKEILSQKEMDETIQGALYMQAKDFYIAHQDRPYVVNLHKALYSLKISLEKMYCCGVFGLDSETKPYEPYNFYTYFDIESIPKGKSVILSPYAKSVTVLQENIWMDIVSYYKENNYMCFTNVVGDEKPLKGTVAISPRICEMQSVVERAGNFVGLRSGICDVIKTARANKIALFPEYNYCDTNWRAIDIYYLDGWKNIVVRDGFKWKN